MSESAGVLVFKEQNIVAYDEFRAQLKDLEKWNSTAVFDYEDPKGNKEARSHIYKLRQTKSAVDRVRKDHKQEALEYGRRVDGQAREIVSQIENMIEVHQKPLDEIEQREKDRVAGHQAKIEEIGAFLEIDPSQGSNLLKGILEELVSAEPDESFEEFTAPAISIWKQAKERIEKALAARLKYEAEQAELERLRAEQEERERKEREEQIAREAAERARQEAEEKAKAEAEAAAKREAEAKAATERAEQARIEAEERSKREAEEAEKRHQEALKAAEERAKREAEETKRAQEEAARNREANQKHKASINNAAAKALTEHAGLSSEQAKQVVVAIDSKQIPNITISY